jgi:hypothetical protein
MAIWCASPHLPSEVQLAASTNCFGQKKWRPAIWWKGFVHLDILKPHRLLIILFPFIHIFILSPISGRKIREFLILSQSKSRLFNWVHRSTVDTVDTRACPARCPGPIHASAICWPLQVEHGGAVKTKIDEIKIWPKQGWNRWNPRINRINERKL